MKSFVATFDTADALIRGAKAVANDGFSPADAVTPFRFDEVEELIGTKRPAIRPIMAAAGFLGAAFAYSIEWFSAAIAYPINSGGRPLNSWPVFILVPFEVGVLCAGLAGFITFLVHCGMPSLHHPIFGVNGIERATSDRFFLIVDGTGDVEGDVRLKESLRKGGAIAVEEMVK